MSSQMETVPEFKRRPGVEGHLGSEFERNLTLLVSLRCQRLHEEGIIKHYRVLENVDDAGAFDDVVVKLIYLDSGVAKNKLVFIQAKHRADINKHAFIGTTLFSQSKPEIQKYYSSCCQILDIIKNKKVCIKQKGQQRDIEKINSDRSNLQKIFDSNTDDCMFVYYTNMPIGQGLLNVERAIYQIDDTDDIVKIILNTSGGDGKNVLSLNNLHCDENKVCGPESSTENVSNFCKNFRIYTKQESKLESVVIQEINLFTNSNLNIAFYSKFLSEFSNIFTGNYCMPVTDASNMFSNIRNLVILEQENAIAMEGYKYFTNLFEKNTLQTFFDKIKSHSVSYILTTNERKGIEFVKFIELSKNYSSIKNDTAQNFLFLILKNSAAVNLWTMARKTECYKKYHTVFLFVEDQIIKNNVSSRLKNEHFLILFYSHKSQESVEMQQIISPSDLSTEISEIGWNQFFQYEIYLQGYPTNLTMVKAQSLFNDIGYLLIYEMARNNVIKIGGLLPCFDKYYIERTFKHFETNLRDPEFARDCLTRKFTIISDVAGMGKTTSLKFLCTHIKALHKNYWVQFIELKMHIKALSYLEMYISPGDAVDAVSKFLSLSELEGFIFRNSCIKAGNAVLLFDGYDEISPQAEEQFKYLLKALSKTNIHSIIVSTRPNYASALENDTNFNFTNIIGFTHHDQEQYLSKYWGGILIEEGIDTTLLRNVVQHVIRRMEDKSEVLDEVAGIPLQSRMIADIYLEEVKKCLYAGNTDNIITSIDLTQLYDRFINLHIERCMAEKIGIKNLEQSWFDRIKSDMFKLESGIWEALACKEILPKLEISKQFQASDIRSMQDVGIVAKLDPITFMHRTFAEFLAAKYVANIITVSCDENALKFLFDEIFTRENRAIMRTVDHRLSDQYTVFRIFLSSLLSNQVCIECNETCHSGIRYEIKLYENKPPKYLWLLPSTLAAYDGNTGILQFLLQHGADINCCDMNGYLPIQLAARGAHTDSVKCLVQHGVDVNFVGNKCLPPIYIAAESGCITLVEYLVKCGADVNSSTEFGLKPIHAAAERGHIDILKYLLQQGADINSKDRYGYTVAWLAIWEGRTDLLKYLVQCDADIIRREVHNDKLILHAASCGRTDTVEYLFQHGADMNCRDYKGNTLIHLAARNVKSDLVKFLVEHGADVNSRNTLNDTPLHMVARRMGPIDTVNFLVYHGADLNAINNKGRKPETLAFRRCFGSSFDKLNFANYLRNLASEQKL